jgi:hypothetical protein
LLGSFYFYYIFAKASAQLKVLPVLRIKLGALASAENVCFADSEAELMTAFEVSDDV